MTPHVVALALPEARPKIEGLHSMLPRNPLQPPRRATNPHGEGERGVFQDIEPLEGTEAFNIYGSNGKRLGRWEAVQGVTDDQLLDAFEEMLVRREPCLSITPPSRAPYA